LQHFTGSKNHNVSLRELALKKGYSLSEQGIKVKGKKKPFSSEKKFYNFLGLDWIPPELREDTGEIQAAAHHRLPNLIKLPDIKGDFHTHTNYHWVSSHDYGQSSPETLISKAAALGYQYLALGDHNPSLKNYSQTQALAEIKKRSQYLRGLKLSEKVSKNRTPKLLVTLEVDIRPDGSLALPPSAHTHLDFVIASVHSSLGQNRDLMTQRVLKAIAAPGVRIIGHPTGRLINSRPGFELDWSQIFKACHKHHVALEINANPSRLDLDAQLARQAGNAGVKLSIGTDAHDVRHLDYLSYGVDVARRAWLTKASIINTFSFKQLQTWLNK
jgi:DNA polymerase (family 10)